MRGSNRNRKKKIFTLLGPREGKPDLLVHQRQNLIEFILPDDIFWAAFGTSCSIDDVDVLLSSLSLVLLITRRHCAVLRLLLCGQNHKEPRTNKRIVKTAG